MALNGYVVHTYSGYENKVKWGLQERVELANAQAYFPISWFRRKTLWIDFGGKENFQTKIFPRLYSVRMERMMKLAHC